MSRDDSKQPYDIVGQSKCIVSRSAINDKQ